MGSSSSSKRAQTIKLCELCEEDSIQWRCIDCEKCLCEQCKFSHLRIPVAAQHKLVAIGTHLQEKIAIDNIPCKDHPQKMTCSFCRCCDSLFCPDCVSGHKKHNFVPIELALAEKLDYLTCMKEKINDNLKCCDSKTSEIQDIKPKYNAIFDESLSKIKEKELDLIDSTQKYSIRLQEDSENERSDINRSVSEIEKDVYKTKKNLEDQRNEIDALITSSQGKDIFKTNMTITDVKFDLCPYQVQQFIPGIDYRGFIEDLFGSLKTLTLPTNHAIPEMEVIGSFSEGDCWDYIDTIITIDESTAWIKGDAYTLIKKVKIKDNDSILAIDKKIKLGVFDMALTPNNELLLSLFDESDIKLLKTSGEIVSFLSVAPLLPRGIHVTKDNDVIVGVTESSEGTPKDQCQTAIIVFGKDHKQKHKYQYKRNGERLPYKIKTNNNQDILVIDANYCSEHGGNAVVVLNKEGGLRYAYEGHSSVNYRSYKCFKPCDVATTTGGNIIISDIGANALHVLSQDGEVLICKYAINIGMDGVFGLDIDREGRLWVGCHSGVEDCWKKLHIFKLVY